MKIKLTYSEDEIRVKIFHATSSQFHKAKQTLKSSIPAPFRRFDYNERHWIFACAANDLLSDWLKLFPRAEIIRETAEPVNFHLSQPAPEDLIQAVSIWRSKNPPAPG